MENLNVYFIHDFAERKKCFVSSIGYSKEYYTVTRGLRKMFMTISAFYFLFLKYLLRSRYFRANYTALLQASPLSFCINNSIPSQASISMELFLLRGYTTTH